MESVKGYFPTHSWIMKGDNRTRLHGREDFAGGDYLRGNFSCFYLVTRDRGKSPTTEMRVRDCVSYSGLSGYDIIYSTVPEMLG
jgi:hypothetical protein